MYITSPGENQFTRILFGSFLLALIAAVIAFASYGRGRKPNIFVVVGVVVLVFTLSLLGGFYLSSSFDGG